MAARLTPDEVVAAKARAVVAQAERGGVSQVAHAAGVSRVTLWQWQQDDPAFAEAMEQAKDEAIARLHNSVYDRGLAGDTKAATFMLEVMDRKTYGRDRDGLSLNIGGTVIISQVPPPQRLDMLPEGNVVDVVVRSEV